MFMDLLNKVATTALLGFVVSSMMAMGVGFTVRQIIDALRDVRLVLLALLANFVAMPLGALALDKMLRLDELAEPGQTRLGQSGRISRLRMAEKLRVEKSRSKMRC